MTEPPSPQPESSQPSRERESRPTRSLAGTVAIVTGSSSGIGEATARRLAAEGAATALVARRRDRLEDLAGSIRSDGGTALVVVADLSERLQAADAVARLSSTAGRVARPGSRVYNLTKFGVNAFSESLRQELLKERVRVSVVEPGTVDTELVTQLDDEAQNAARAAIDSIEPLQPADIAEAVTYMIVQGRRVAINEILVRAGEQTW